LRPVWDHEPSLFLVGADVRRLTFVSDGNQSLLASAPARFMESLHLLSHTHWDHELVRPRSRRPPRPRKRPDRVGCRGRERGGGRVARLMERESREQIAAVKVYIFSRKNSCEDDSKGMLHC